MNDLDALRTAWHDAQKHSIRALAYLFSNWNSLSAHTRYDAATRAEKEAEFRYLKALASRGTKRAQQ